MNNSNQDQGEIVSARVVDIMAPDEVDLPKSPPEFHLPQRRIGIPIVLFIATCLSTFYVSAFYSPANSISGKLEDGLLYAGSLMIILVCHEMGHFLQSYRYGVFSTWPYFIPVPLPPIGTMGAVIAMEPRMGHRRALFDIGITGPLAGLVPTIICCIVGIQLSKVELIAPSTNPGLARLPLGEPLLFTYLIDLLGRPHDITLYPVAFAGWVGLLITSLNLIPIGQLDGGHILYALLQKKAHYIATFLLLAALVAVAREPKLWGWSLMLILLLIMGPKHPPTADDDEPLGLLRYILGWLTLAFVLIGFTPQPFVLN